MALNIFKLNPSAVGNTAILIKDADVNAGNTSQLYNTYLKKLIDLKVPMVGSSVIFIGLPYPAAKNITKSFMTPVVDEIVEYCETAGITTLLIADSKYFGIFTGVNKIENSIGYKFKCLQSSSITVLPSLHYNILFYNPTRQTDIDWSVSVLASVMLGTYTEPGNNSFTLEYYKDSTGLENRLGELLEYESLTCDIEATGLRFEVDEVLTISFGISQTKAIAIAVHNMYHSTNEEAKILAILKKFFIKASSKVCIKYHNGLFDLKFLIRRLFMHDGGDFTGMYRGIDIMCNNIDDTMLIAYLATNSTDRAVLGLKALSMEYMGDYAVEVKNAVVVDVDTLLEYNAKDCCATWYVYDKYYPILVDDDQVGVYNSIFKASMPGLIEMMMTGLPMNMSRISSAYADLEKIINDNRDIIAKSHYINRTNMILRYYAMQKYNDTHKKQKAIEDFTDLVFNSGSSAQLRILLFDIMKFDPIEKTETGESSTGKASIKAFLAQAKNDNDKDAEILLEAILAVSAADKIKGTFISAFEEFSHKHPSGDCYLNGNLKLGGTASGRLSSNNPNLQNLPSKSDYGKLVKECFVAPEGWLFCGADFNALEDKIGAILSKDEMKTLEFSQNMDGHSLRALAFFPEELPDLDKNDPEQVNSIKTNYPKIRDRAKAPSFALQYSGTWVTIQRTLGCSKEKAMAIEVAYHELYSGLAAFAKENEKHAMAKGYVNCAFGLRLRTPLLAKCKSGADLSSEAAASSRSANNATTQSWGMLTNRAIIDFRNRLSNSEFRDSVRLINTIHDAIYLLVKNDISTIKFVNDNLIDCMSWQEDPAIQSDKVKLGAELDIGKSWAKQISLKNNVSANEIQEFLTEHGLVD